MLLTRLYYWFKPFIPRAIRMPLLRRRARYLLRGNGNIWPINSSAAVPPEGWTGWPEHKSFAFVLTHDVESQRGVDQVKQLAELEMELGFRSSFNFIPEGGYVVPEELRSWLTGNGFEVGVHDLHHDGHLYDSRKAFEKSADRINCYLKEWGAVGFRSGFMLRRLDWLHDLNILYDASTFDTDPFEPQPDGAKRLFPFIVSNGHKEYVELPYTLPQDSTLFLLLENKDARIWKDKLQWISGHGGLALVNIHPDYINFSDGQFGHSLYPVSLIRSFLEEIRQVHQDQFWHPLPHKLASWYQSTVPVRVESPDPVTISGLPVPQS